MYTFISLFIFRRPINSDHKLSATGSHTYLKLQVYPTCLHLQLQVFPDRPTRRPTGRPTTGRPTGQPTDQPTDRPADRPTDCRSIAKLQIQYDMYTSWLYTCVPLRIYLYSGLQLTQTTSCLRPNSLQVFSDRGTGRPTGRPADRPTGKKT